MMDNNTPTFIKMPETAPIDVRSGHFNKEWIYFFESLGRSGDEQELANLSRILQELNAAKNNVTSLQKGILDSPTPITQTQENFSDLEVMLLALIQKNSDKLDSLEHFIL